MGAVNVPGNAGLALCCCAQTSVQEPVCAAPAVRLVQSLACSPQEALLPWLVMLQQLLHLAADSLCCNGTESQVCGNLTCCFGAAGAPPMFPGLLPGSGPMPNMPGGQIAPLPGNLPVGQYQPISAPISSAPSNILVLSRISNIPTLRNPDERQEVTACRSHLLKFKSLLSGRGASRQQCLSPLIICTGSCLLSSCQYALRLKFPLLHQCQRL